MEWCWSTARNDWFKVERGFCVGMSGISIFSFETRFHSTKDVAVLGSAAVITLLHQGPTSFNGLISKYRSACRPTQSPFPPNSSRTNFDLKIRLVLLEGIQKCAYEKNTFKTAQKRYTKYRNIILQNFVVMCYSYNRFERR